MAEIIGNRIDHRQHRRHRAEIAGQVDAPPDFAAVGGPLRETVVLVAIDIGVRALETENRLFVIANHEQRALDIAGAIAIEPGPGQRLDDLPLPGVGILRFIDKHMVDALVELVAHPIGRPRCLQQPLRRRDHVVIIDHPEPCLGIDPVRRQPHPDAQMGGGMGGGGIEILFGNNRHHRLAEPDEQRFERRIGLGRAGRDGAFLANGLVLPGQEKAAQPVERGGAVLRTQPAMGFGGRRRRCLAAIAGEGIGQPRHPRRIEARQRRHQRRLCIAVGGQPEAAPQHRLDAFALQSGQRFGMAAEPGDDLRQPALPGSDADRRQIVHERRIMIPRFDGGSQQPPTQQRARPVIKGSKARRHPGLDREAGDQPLRKGMDGLHRQPLRRIEHIGEQPPRLCLHFGRIIGAQRLQVADQFGIAAPRPMRQPAEHPRLHLGRRQLGESQAQDRVRRRALQQQPQHPGRQYLRLAGARRSRHPGMGLGFGGARLFGLQQRETGHRRHRTNTSRFGRSCHSATRARWSKSLQP